MKNSVRFFIRTLVVFAIGLLCGCATNHHSVAAGNPMNANLIMLDARINAANGHYKTLLITIADKQTNARITTSKSEIEQLRSDLALLGEDRRTTENQITGLVNEYNHHQVESGKHMKANLILLDAKINAANGHYKTVLITIADKQTNARTTTSKSELEQLNTDLALLYKDRRTTEDQITGFVSEYNASLE